MATYHDQRRVDAAINARIADIQFHRFPGTDVTVCCLKLSDDTTRLGLAVIDDDNEGRAAALANARDRLRDSIDQ